MTARARFTQADITRTLKSFARAGLSVAGVEVNDNGFVVLVGEPRSKRPRNKADELYGPPA